MNPELSKIIKVAKFSHNEITLIKRALSIFPSKIRRVVRIVRATKPGETSIQKNNTAKATLKNKIKPAVSGKR